MKDKMPKFSILITTYNSILLSDKPGGLRVETERIERDGL